MNQKIDSLTDRIEWLDTAKGIAMLCIIAGHMDISIVNRTAYTFHVPIFLKLVGIFLGD